MKLKRAPNDFIVREMLREGYVAERGPFRVYRVTKRKRTSFEAAGVLARMAGVDAGEIGLAGLKDRQGVTTQYMSVRGGKLVRWRSPEISIDQAGFAAERLESRHSLGNQFEVTLDAPAAARARIEAAVESVGKHGLPNYFGEQRFGNLGAGQGWIARDLALGHQERALKNLLCASSERDDPKSRKFKAALASRWGDWRACREMAGVFGAHHSVFEHLARNLEDFAGAFRRVASRIRLIHLYAWQSHLWNRAVARYVEEITPARELLSLSAPEGRLFFHKGALSADPEMHGNFRLPGPRLEDVTHPRQRALFAEVLAREGLRPEHFHVQGVPGFQLKGEDRALIVRPRDLRVDDGPRGLRFTFSLPRGGYALLVVRRILGEALPERVGRGSGPRSGVERERRGPPAQPKPSPPRRGPAPVRSKRRPA